MRANDSDQAFNYSKVQSNVFTLKTILLVFF